MKKIYIFIVLLISFFAPKVLAEQYDYYESCSYLGLNSFSGSTVTNDGKRCIPGGSYVVGTYLYTNISYLSYTNLGYAYQTVYNYDFFDVYYKFDDDDWDQMFGTASQGKPYYSSGDQSETVCITHVDGEKLPDASCPEPSSGGSSSTPCEDDERKSVRFTYINAEGEEVSSRSYSLCPGAILYANQVPVVPDRTGLKFNKWIVKKKDGNIVTNQEEFKIGDKINNSYEVEATYAYTTYNITYDLNGGDLPASGASAYDQNYTCALNDNFSAGCIAPSNPPTRNGYDFLGWSTKVTNNYYSGEHSTIDPGANIGSLLIDSNVGGSNDVTLYAVWKPHVYDITYDLNGEAVVLGQLLGTLPGKYTVDQVITFGSPSRPGYTFGGWYTDPSFDQDSLITNTDGKTTDLYLYAKWTAASFTVKYKVGDEDFDSIPCTYNNCPVNIDNPTQAGFLYWIDNENGYIYKKGNSIKNVSTNITLNAVFSTDGRKTITYADRESYSFPNQPVESYVPNVPTNLPIPEKDGYIFNGWTINGTGRAVYSLSENYNTDLTLTPNWSEKKITVVYDYNNGEADVTYECKFGQESCNPPANPTKTGYIFKGWSLTNDDDDLINNTDSYLDIINGVNRGQTSKTLKLHAIWEEDTHLILYNLDGGTANFQNATTSTSLANNNGSITLPSSVTKDDWTFTEWEPVNTGLVTGDAENGYKLADNISAGVPVTFKANYSRKTLNIKYLNDNVSYGDDQTCDYINICRINKHNPTHDNYVFKYWLDPSRGLMYPGYNSIVKGVYGELNLVAIYNDQDTHSIILTNDEGATYSGAPIRDYVTGVGTNLPIPSKPGYKFNGWKVQNTDDIIYSIPANANTDYTLEAQWSKKTYHIYYALNGGINNSGNTDSFTIPDDTSNNTITLGAPTHNDPHYLFGGWTVLNPSSSFAVNDGQITINDYENLTDIVLAANWIHNEYEIVYDLNGNGAVNGTGNVTSYGINDDPIVITNPTRANYSFTGWEVVSGNATLARDPENNQNILTVLSGYGDVYLKATWSKDLYSINYDLNGNGAVNSDNNPVSYNPSISDTIVITNPTRDDYVFMGWEVASGNADLSEGPENNQNTLTVSDSHGDVYLKATWSKDLYSINYDLNGNGAVNGDNNPVSYNPSISDPIVITNPTRANYSFTGWEVASGNATLARDPENNQNILTVSDSHGDIYLKATWSKDLYSINYDLNGTGAVNGDNNPVSYNPSISDTIVINEPTRDDYVFMGWEVVSGNADLSEGPENNQNTLTVLSGYGDVYLKAIWSPNRFKINYDLNGGTAGNNPDSYYLSSSDPILITDPTRTGYDFNDWEVVSGNGVVTGIAGTNTSRLFANALIGGDINIRANWVVSTRSINIDLAGGEITGYAPTSYTYGTTSVSLSKPVKTGYVFAGWTITPNTVTYDENNNKLVLGNNLNEDVELVANWNPDNVSVTYCTSRSDQNDCVDQISTEMVGRGSSHVIAVEPVNDDINKRFLYWISDDGRYFTPGQNVIITDNIKFYPYYYDLSEVHTITYNLDDGEFTNGDAVYRYKVGDTFNLTESVSKEGYIFMGWYTDPEFTESSKITDVSNSNTDLVLYAKWAQPYKIVLHSSDGEEMLQTIVRDNMDVYSLGPITVNEHPVVKWASQPNSREVAYTEETDWATFAQFGQVYNLYAIEDKYTIVLHSNDGNTVLDTITNWDLNSYQIGAFTIDDHDVVKWASQPNSREVAYTAETDWAGSEFGQVYNLYAIEDFYTIRLHSNDGNEDIETIVRYNKNSYSLGAKKYNGRNVYNWSTVANDNTIRYNSETDFGSIAEYENVFDLYAVYTVKVNYHYEAYLDDGRSPEMEKDGSATYLLDESVNFDSLSGYAGSDGNATLFNNLEWYTDDSYTDQFDLTTVFDINSPEEINLYAREDFYTVTFHYRPYSREYTDSIEILENRTITDDTAITFGNSDYTYGEFDWYTDTYHLITFNNNGISSSIDLYAQRSTNPSS